MATFNTPSKGSMRTTNLSGHAAYRLDDRTKLMTMVLTTMLNEKKFYGDNTNELIRLAESLCGNGDGEFVAKLAVWARTKGNMRSVSHALIAVIAHHCYGEPFVRPATRIVASQRGDDGTEILATYKALYGKKVRWPHAIQRGVMDALAYSKPFSLAKYQSSGKSMKLRDVLRMTHPKARRSDTEDAMGKVIDGTLPVPKGWETELSARGNTKEVWDELLSEGKVPFMAALRNMRNIISSGADVTPVLDMLASEDAVRRSRQLPFRFFSAYVELSKAGLASTRVTRAIDTALANACVNVDRLPGKTAVLIDVSGSMGYRISDRSITACRDIAALLGAMAAHVSDDAMVIQFSNGASVVPMLGTSVLSDIGKVRLPSGGTNMAAGFDCLIRSGFDANRVIVLSDNEVNGGWYRNNTKTIQTKLDEYRRKVGHDVWCHAIDLQGFGTSNFIGRHVNVMAGWSDSVLRFVALVERGEQSLLSEIESVQLA